MSSVSESSERFAHSKEKRNKREDVTQTATENMQEYGSRFVAEPAKDVFSLLKDYAKEKPDVAAIWCFGFGVLVGWKLRG